MMQQETMGDRIRKARQAKGVTQKELGFWAGLSATSISNLERGCTTVSPRIETLQEIASALDVKLVYLLYGKRRLLDRLLNRWPIFTMPTRPWHELPEVAYDPENDDLIQVPSEEGDDDGQADAD